MSIAERDSLLWVKTSLPCLLIDLKVTRCGGFRNVLEVILSLSEVSYLRVIVGARALVEGRITKSDALAYSMATT
jgi:hypothetical protein